MKPFTVQRNVCGFSWETTWWRACQHLLLMFWNSAVLPVVSRQGRLSPRLKKLTAGESNPLKYQAGSHHYNLWQSAPLQQVLWKRFKQFKVSHNFICAAMGYRRRMEPRKWVELVENEVCGQGKWRYSTSVCPWCYGDSWAAFTIN